MLPGLFCRKMDYEKGDISSLKPKPNQQETLKIEKQNFCVGKWAPERFPAGDLGELLPIGKNRKK